MKIRPVSRILATSTVCAAAALAAAEVHAERLFQLVDPRGDDNGSGVLIYPNRDDLQPGDLDLHRFSADRTQDGIWFSVEMAQPIRSPEGRVTEVGQTPVNRLARNGFYTFNVDVYIDIDRIAGSGRTDAVPGRGVGVNRAYAWERCVVLTPRPDVARAMLQIHLDKQFEKELRAEQGKVSRDELKSLQSRSEQQVEDLYFFPNRVRVQGRRVEFFVPLEFLGAEPSPSWGYTVVVTGADIDQTGRPGRITPERPLMMTMAVARGNRHSQFGIRVDADPATPPVVDLLAPDRATQVSALTDYDSVAGRLAAMPGMAPDGNVAVAATGTPLTMEQLSRIDETTDPRAAPDAGSAAAPPPERRTVPARLRTLNQLLEEGLITQEEYDQLRRKILAEL